MWNESAEQKIRRLEEGLYRARYAVVTLLPEPIRALVATYRDVETYAQADTWEDELVDAVIELARRDATESVYSGLRADCPLCRNGSWGPYAGGFAIPGGLRIHLLGERRARPCTVMTPVLELARADWMPRVHEAEARERAATEAGMQLRREREDLFLTDPRSAPRLRDEPSFLSMKARDDDSLAWAEARLQQLGFSESRIDRVRQFSKEYDGFVVYADPREAGRLEFIVLRKDQLEKPKGRRRWTPDHGSFHLLDSWRNDLSAKFESRADEAMRSLMSRSKK